MSDPRDIFVSQVASGRSFIDVGGLFQIDRERITTAHRAGATHLALLDLENEACPWWHDMRTHLDKQGVGACDFISADILKADLRAYDIVHSSGVLYHMPKPIEFIRKLRKITSAFCILTSVVISTRVVGLSAELHFPESGMLFVPSLKEPELSIVNEWFAKNGYGDIANPVDAEGPLNYFRNWFIPTVSSFKSLALSSGFEIIADAAIDSCAHTLLLKPDNAADAA
jgi:hypothetical protein